jgi:hypothetical protein
MGCDMDFSKWRPEILHEIEYLVFHHYYVFFGKKNAFNFYQGNIMSSVIKVEQIYDFISNVPPCQ